MRFPLTIALALLFQWLYNAQAPHDTSTEHPCEAVPWSVAAASFLPSPLSLYSWLTSTLLRVLLSLPTLLLTSLHQSLLLLLAGPWCFASVCLSAILTCLHVALYLLHLALVIGVGAILIVTRHKMADSDTAVKGMSQLQKKAEKRHIKSRLRLFGRRFGH